MTPGLARLRAHRHAETIRRAVLADQESALADAGAAIAADNAAAMIAKPEPSPANPGLSEGAAKIMAALLNVAGDGSWIDQKAIPHGMTGKAIAGYLSGLQKRGLVELRHDGGAKFSARMTMASFALVQEPAP